MGQKVHPYGFRLGYNKDWHSHWFAKKQFGEFLLEDLKLKRDLKQRFAGAGVSHVDIERAANRLKIIIYTSRPGIIIGRKGAEIDKLKSDLSSKTGREVLVSIQEIHKPELNAQLQAEKIAAQLEKRIAFRRAMRKAVEESLRFGAQGIKVKVSGRLNGAEIARSEWHLQGQLPLHTLRADIDYGFSEAHTTYGIIGVKTWIYKGEILPGGKRSLAQENEPRRNERPPMRDRDRGDRGDRRGPRPDGGGRGEGTRVEMGRTERPAVEAAPVSQAAPEPRAARAGGPIMPPLMAPTQAAIATTAAIADRRRLLPVSRTSSAFTCGANSSRSQDRSEGAMTISLPPRADSSSATRTITPTLCSFAAGKNSACGSWSKML